MVKKLFAKAGDARDMVQSLGEEDLLEKEVITHSSILAWKIPRRATIHRAHKELDAIECTHIHTQK